MSLDNLILLTGRTISQGEEKHHERTLELVVSVRLMLMILKSLIASLELQLKS